MQFVNDVTAKDYRLSPVVCNNVVREKVYELSKFNTCRIFDI